MMAGRGRFAIAVRTLVTATGFVAATSVALAGPKSYELLPTDSREPHLLGEGVISTPGDEAGGVFSPDGEEFYFVKLNPATTFPRIGLLCVSRWRDGKWSEPEALPFSGKYLDFPPRLSPDGKTMYFGSLRPAPESKSRVMRIWKVEKRRDGWSAPQPLAAPVNLDDHWNWGASVTSDGTMYFASDRDVSGRPQIFRSRIVSGAYQTTRKNWDRKLIRSSTITIRM